MKPSAGSPVSFEGHRTLSEYFDAAMTSAKNIRESGADGLAFLEHVHGCFRDICDKSFNGMPAFAAALSFHSHSMFLAAALTTISGHAAAAYPIVRACLESALYCLHIAKNPDLAKVWAERNDSWTARKACRDAFTAGRVLATALEANPALGKIVRDTYDELIDYGAHPNAIGVFKNFTVSEVEAGIQVEVHYLHGSTPARFEPMTAGLEVAVYAMALILAAFRDDAADPVLAANVQELIDLGQRRSVRKT